MIIRNKLIDAFKYLKNQKYKEMAVEDYSALPELIFNNLESIFVLSTGRCGTELLERLFKLIPGNYIYHEPKPELIYSSKLAHQLGSNGIEARKLGFLSARYEILKKAYLHQKRYIETNHHLTFYADAISEILPKAKFIHLVRHPASFVRSGIRRNYYIHHDYDDGRIIPLPEYKISSDWEFFGQLKKISWLWNETNQHIEDFKTTIPSSRILTMKSEKLFEYVDGFEQILTFLNMNVVSPGKISRLISRPRNIQYKGSFPRFSAWSEKQKSELRDTAILAADYNYNLNE